MITSVSVIRLAEMLLRSESLTGWTQRKPVGSCDGHVISRQIKSDQSQQRLFTPKPLVICAVCTFTAFPPSPYLYRCGQQGELQFQTGNCGLAELWPPLPQHHQIYRLFSEMLRRDGVLLMVPSLNCQPLY